MPSFTLEDVEQLRDVTPKRRRFVESTSDLNADGSFTLGFKFAWVAEIFRLKTGLESRSGPYGPWANFTDPEDIAKAQKWKERHDNYVFLCDNLDYSLALDLNLAAEGQYTDLGLAEHNAKATGDEGSLKVLCKGMAKAVARLPPYDGATAVCAVPPSPDKKWDLPTEIAKRISSACGKEDLSTSIKFTKKKDSVKALSLNEKWKSLEASGLKIASNKIKGKTIILIDDKYQSGTTAQFVASKLYEAGAKSVMGLYCVKTWRDTDNQ